MSDQLAQRLHDFQLTVTGQLAALIQQTAGVKEQVERQNGNVAKLWARSDETLLRVAALEMKIAEERAARQAGEEASEKASGRWERWVRPVALAAIAAVAGWILRNPAAIVKAVTE